MCIHNSDLASLLYLLVVVAAKLVTLLCKSAADLCMGSGCLVGSLAYDDASVATALTTAKVKRP